MLVGAAVGSGESLIIRPKRKKEAVSELVVPRAMRKHMTKLPHVMNYCSIPVGQEEVVVEPSILALGLRSSQLPVMLRLQSTEIRAASSLTGSADVLEVLGVTLSRILESVASRLDEIGICFCFAAKSSAMRHVVGVGKKLGVKTLFNLLGPLCNPAGATHQLLGTSSLDAQNKVADALRKLGTRRSYVIHAEDGQDEISLDGINRIIEVTSESSVIHEWGERVWLTTGWQGGISG